MFGLPSFLKSEQICLFDKLNKQSDTTEKRLEKEAQKLIEKQEKATKNRNDKIPTLVGAFLTEVTKLVERHTQNSSERKLTLNIYDILTAHWFGPMPTPNTFTELQKSFNYLVKNCELNAPTPEECELFGNACKEAFEKEGVQVAFRFDPPILSNMIICLRIKLENQ